MEWDYIHSLGPVIVAQLSSLDVVLRALAVACIAIEPPSSAGMKA